MTKTKASKSIQSFPNWLRVSIVALVLVTVVGGGSLFAYAQTLKGEIHPGVTVAGTNLGGLTVAEARAALEARITAYEKSAAFVTVGGKKQSVNLERLGVSVDVEATLEKAFGVGRSSLFAPLTTLPLIRGEIEVDPVVTVNQKVLSKYVSNIITQETVPAADASIVYTDGKAEVLPEKNGTTVELQPSIAMISDAATSLQAIDLSFASKVLRPSVFAKDLQHGIDEANAMVDSAVTVRYGKTSVVLHPEDLSSLLVVGSKAGSSSLAFSFDESKLKSVLQPIHDAAYTAPKEVRGYIGEVEGEYAYKNYMGRDVDWNASEAAILEALQNDTATSVEAVVTEMKPKITIETVTSPKTEGKVIAVDLAHQAVFAFEDGTLKFWTHASTGRRGFDTPTGEWKVYAKTPIQVMDGPDYYLPNVKWVMPYDGDYTLHTAYWHTNFGQPMSHGCTNLSEADAKWLYDWAQIGTPVVIYDSEAA